MRFSSERALARRWQPVRLTMLLISVGWSLIPMVGCGPSQEDLMMRAARRSRPTNGSDEDEQPRKPVAAKPQAAKPAAAPAAKPDAPLGAQQEANPGPAPQQDSQPPSGIDQQETLASILQRRPSEPLDASDARQMAADNIEAIAAALLAYQADKGRFPNPNSTAAGGIPTLSWRVELLPYLGYEDLYKKFDFNMPWNREPNKSLLEFIPPQYTSPERWDTQTNYQLPVNDGFIASGNRIQSSRKVEDGLENTILLVEVNDKLAVHWTKPADYRRINKSMKDDFAFRGGGTFAVWANGWTVMLADGLTDKQFHNCFSIDSGDGQTAGMVHRDVPRKNLSEASLASLSTLENPDDNAGPDAPSDAAPVVEGGTTRPVPVAVARERTPVPIAADVSAAKKRLGQLFADKIKDATSDNKKAELAREMLDMAFKMESDPAGAFALQSAAMRMASEVGDANVLIDAIDQRVGMFEVDPYEENVSKIIEFGSTHDPESVDGDTLVQRAVRVIYAGIEDNDFIRASAVARISYRYTNQERRETIPRLLNRLKSLLAGAQREYDDSVNHLKAYREDPSDNEAAAAFGRFLCFIKGDWQNGLPLIAKGGSEILRELASRDLNGAKSISEKIGLADAWWELSERARSGPYRQGAIDRSVFWYSQVYGSLPESLDRMHVKSRLDEAEGIDATSPIAMCIQVADELGVDLTVSLAGVADVGQVSGGGLGGRDDRDRD